MNNEPVALMTEYGIHPLHKGALQEGMFLYTHLAKTLTDEEIMDCIEDKTGYSFNACDEDLLDFARAILRKAQDNG
jgi:hypothetical protein